MLTIYKTAEAQLTTVSEIANGTWLNVIDSPPGEVNRLSEELGIPIDYLTYPLDIDERALTEKDEGGMLIILRVPRYEGDTADVPYVTVPLGIILTERAIVTVCKADSDILSDFVGGRVKGWSTGKRNRFVLQICSSLRSAICGIWARSIRPLISWKIAYRKRHATVKYWKCSSSKRAWSISLPRCAPTS